MSELTRRQLAGSHGAKVLAGQQVEHLASLSPTLSRYIPEDGFGDVLANATTSHRKWDLQVLSLLTAIRGAGNQSEVYLKAVQHGATEYEVRDVPNLCCLYAGAPRAFTAARRMADYLNQVQERMFPGSVRHAAESGLPKTMVEAGLGACKSIRLGNIPK